jgi:hypothetical protein
MLNNTEVKKALRQIDKAQDAREDLEAWSVLAAERFKPKDQVIFNERAKKKGVFRHRKGIPKQGVVLSVGDMKTPFEIFRERAVIERDERPHYRKDWKRKPSRQFIPISDEWWQAYGYKWNLDVVEVSIRATMRVNPYRVPFANQVHSYIEQELPSERLNYSVTTYEFEPVAWLQILTAAQYKNGEWRQYFEREFWRQAEPLINENTKVTTN